MGKLAIPGELRLRSGRTPTVHQYVAAFLTQMRAETRKTTVFGPAGRAVVQRPGERVLLAPDGTPIRVVELPEGGNQVEHGDHLHAHVRPRVVTGPVPISTAQARRLNSNNPPRRNPS